MKVNKVPEFKYLSHHAFQPLRQKLTTQTNIENKQLYSFTNLFHLCRRSTKSQLFGMEQTPKQINSTNICTDIHHSHPTFPNPICRIEIQSVLIQNGRKMTVRDGPAGQVKTMGWYWWRSSRWWWLLVVGGLQYNDESCLSSKVICSFRLADERLHYWGTKSKDQPG